MVEIKNLKIWACYYYHMMDFNCTHIIPDANIERDKNLAIKKNAYKSSTNNRETYGFMRQSLEELESFDWKIAKGIGTVTGFNGLRALDFDLSSKLTFIKKVLYLLDLPQDYEWVVKTGSGNGFHVIFYCEDCSYAGDKKRLRRYFPNTTYGNMFKCLDFIWFNHLNLPPSIHKSGNTYSFMFIDYPIKKPQIVSEVKLRQTLNELCFEYGGYNITRAKLDNGDYYNVPIIDTPIIVNQSDYDNYLNKNNQPNIEVSHNNETLYYNEIATSLDKVYLKRKYELGLEKLKELLKYEFANKNIIEIACGNGYWTKYLSEYSKSVFATDFNNSCISEAKNNVESKNVKFNVMDCFDLKTINKFEGLFGGFIISHINVKLLPDFFDSIHSVVKNKGTVVLFDNRLVPDNNMEIDKTDFDGNSYQQRITPTGNKYLIMKNFFELNDLKKYIKNIAYDIEYIKLKYFWTLKYKVNQT